MTEVARRFFQGRQRQQVTRSYTEILAIAISAQAAQKILFREIHWKPGAQRGEVSVYTLERRLTILKKGVLPIPSLAQEHGCQMLTCPEQKQQIVTELWITAARATAKTVLGQTAHVGRSQ